VPEAKKKCAETGVEIGPGTAIDAYKWTITVFSLPDVGREQLLKTYGPQTNERARRIVANLTPSKRAAAAEEEE